MLLAACTGGEDDAQPAAAAQATGAETQGGTLARIRERGTLVVGAECLYKGTCFLDPDSGERLGYGVDVTNILAQDLGVEVEWVDMEWTALIPAVQTGQIDMITQGVTRTPERAFSVTFTEPMEYYPQALVLPADSPLLEQENFDEVVGELNQPGNVITFLLGGAHQIMVENSFPQAEHRGLESAQAFEEVASGRADAMIADTGDAWDYIQNNPDALIWQDRAISTNQGSFVIPYGDTELLTWLNNWIAYYTSNGTLRNLKLAWNEERGIPADLAGLPPTGEPD
jgi:ABC-type amino acid transport substrate-binding protein